MTLVDDDIARTLSADGYVHASLTGVLGPAVMNGPDWASFAASWDDLRLDPYMGDGGRYRLRRYSEFTIDSTSRRVVLRPHVPYSQPVDINHLNGGIQRLYEPFDHAVTGGRTLADVLGWCVSTLTAAEAPGRWTVQAFQNRILARAGEIGQPTPEGLHRDGVEYVLTLLVDRTSVEGGASAVYAADTGTRVAEVTLTEPGELIFANDVRMLHSVTPLSPAHGVAGHRDVLIAMFTRQYV
jgi:hypothetical protein